MHIIVYIISFAILDNTFGYALILCLGFYRIPINKIDNIENCYINETINTKISNIDDEQQYVYYNSQEKTLNVNFEGDEIITIYDTMGKVVMATTINADTKSISLNLNAGIYIVTNKNQNIYSKFVVK